ncbi:MAG: hypothetical protein GWP06_16920, partial [Actinobacteria bacterium]|nr:hypothetical protein [Actinomycetota bacterium]
MYTIPLEKMSLPFSVVNFELEAVDAIYFDKFPGFIFRSGFGFALRKLCRYKNENIPCKECRLKDVCPYAYIFETPRSDSKTVDFTAEGFPHPFVFQPPFLANPHVSAGQTMHLSLTLFGKGISYLLFYIYAFDLLGEYGLGPARGRFLLKRVTDHLNEKELYALDDKTLRGEPTVQDIVDLQDHNSHDSATLHFLTPAKILNKNRPVKTLQPEVLIKRILGRASLLAQLHTDNKWQFDHKELIARFSADVHPDKDSLQTQVMSPYSVRQKQYQPLDTINGTVT